MRSRCRVVILRRVMSDWYILPNSRRSHIIILSSLTPQSKAAWVKRRVWYTWTLWRSRQDDSTLRWLASSCSFCSEDRGRDPGMSFIVRVASAPMVLKPFRLTKVVDQQGGRSPLLDVLAHRHFPICPVLIAFVCFGSCAQIYLRNWPSRSGITEHDLGVWCRLIEKIV